MRLLACCIYMLTVLGCSGLTLLQYNTSGNGASDWSTNAAQVRAIGRQVAYLNPDIITFNEIPFSHTYQMVHFIRAFLPGFFLATNSATDGYIRSVVASRFPITRSQSWLARSSLKPWGYDGTFTRDLFEAEIQVPNATEPLHVFATHLKCCADTNSVQRRAAEARAISNFFVTVFLPGKSSPKYILSGDLNEDIARPPFSSGHPVQTLTGSSTGFRLLSPANAITGQELTWSVRTLPLTVRFDYVLPCGFLFSNLTSSRVFRSDLEPALPGSVNREDSATGSDHLPVMVQFNYPDPPLVLEAAKAGPLVQLGWASLAGREYEIRKSTDGLSWTLETGVAATGPRCQYQFPAGEAVRWFRLVRTR